MRVDCLLVDVHQLAVLHQQAAVGDGGLTLAAGHAEDHVPVDIRVGKRGEGLVVHHDDVRRGAGLEHAQRVGEVLRADFGVVPEEHVRHLAPADVGQARVGALGTEGDLEGFQHVVGVGVRAHAQEDPGLVEREHRADAHGVAHVALGVVDDHGVGVFDELDLRRIHVDTVTEDGFRAENSVILQPLHGAAAVVLQTVVHVVHALGDMDVIARAAVVGLGHAVKGLI